MEILISVVGAGMALFGCYSSIIYLVTPFTFASSLFYLGTGLLICLNFSTWLQKYIVSNTPPLIKELMFKRSVFDLLTQPSPWADFYSLLFASNFLAADKVHRLQSLLPIECRFAVQPGIVNVLPDKIRDKIIDMFEKNEQIDPMSTVVLANSTSPSEDSTIIMTNRDSPTFSSEIFQAFVSEYIGYSNVGQWSEIQWGKIVNFASKKCHQIDLTTIAIMVAATGSVAIAYPFKDRWDGMKKSSRKIVIPSMIGLSGFMLYGWFCYENKIHPVSLLPWAFSGNKNSLSTSTKSCMPEVDSSINGNMNADGVNFDQILKDLESESICVRHATRDVQSRINRRKLSYLSWKWNWKWLSLLLLAVIGYYSSRSMEKNKRHWYKWQCKNKKISYLISLLWKRFSIMLSQFKNGE